MGAETGHPGGSVVGVALRLGAKVSPFPRFQASAIAGRRAACPHGLGLDEQSGWRAGRTSRVAALGRQGGGHPLVPLLALGSGIPVEGCGAPLVRGRLWRRGRRRVWGLVFCPVHVSKRQDPVTLG